MKRYLFRAAVLLMIFSLLPLAEPATALSESSKLPSPVTSASIAGYRNSVDNLVGRFPNKIDAVFSDIDGTIMQHDKNNPFADASPSAKLAVQKLKAANIPFILTTGRVYPEAKDLAQRLGVENSYIVTQQGAEIRNPKGDLIYKDGLDSKDFRKMISFLEVYKKKNNYSFKIMPIIDGKFYCTEKFDIPYIWSEINQLKSFKDIDKKTQVTSICIFEMNPVVIRNVQKELKKKFPNYNIDISTHCFCDITSSTVSKGNAVKKMAQILGVDLKNCATFGDAENDISMIKLLKINGGLGIAVSNAMPNVKENANYLTDSVSKDGFAKGVDKILQNNNLILK